MAHCPTCGFARGVHASVRSRLEQIDDQWTTVRVAASREYVHKLRTRYPTYEWRAERVTFGGGRNGRWNIEARRIG